MTKQLFIIYDKDYKACAELLYNLLSQHTNIKASMYTQKEIGKLVSREKCLYIGKECTANLLFEDLYDELGVHVGYRGAKAWIRCLRHKWNVSEFKKFESYLENYTKTHKMQNVFELYKKKDKKGIYRQFQTGDESWPGEHWNRILDKNIANKGLYRLLDYVGAMLSLGPLYEYLCRNKLEFTIIRKYQYYIGVFTFYEKYLNDFLEISELDQI